MHTRGGRAANPKVGGASRGRGVPRPAGPPGPAANLRRLARAVHLDALRLEDRTWLVTGGTQSHIVSADARSCDCLDHQLRERGDGYRCKHLLRVLLAEGDAGTWALLRVLVAQPTRARGRARP